MFLVMFDVSVFQSADVGVAPIVQVSPAVVCGLAGGVMVTTPRGLRPVEEIEPGDAVMTCDTGIVRVLWTHWRRPRPVGGAAPVVVEAGVLGNAAQVVLAQQHRVLVRGTSDMGPEVLVRAVDLVDGVGIRINRSARVTYHSLLLPRHDVLFVGGLRVESLLYRDGVAQFLNARRDVVADAALRVTHAQAARPIVAAK